MTDAAGSTAFTWTDGSLFESEQGRWTSDKVTFSYQHRKRSGLALQRPGTSDWTQGYLYDDYGRLKSITSPAGGFTNTAYQSGSFDLVSTFDYPGGSQVTAGYDVMGRLYAKHLYGGGLSPDNHEYSYDAGSQRTQHVFYADMPSYAYDSTDYTYDNIGQLKSAKSFEYYGNTRRHEQFGYTYDASWNLIRRTNNNLVAQFQANGLNQVTNSTRTGTLTVHGLIVPPSSTATVTVSGTGLSSTPADVYSDGAWASQSGATPANGLNTYTATVTDNGQSSQQTVTAYLPSSVTYQYDLNGNLTNDGLRTFEYDFENQLTNVFVTAGWRSEFKYDGLGRRRVRKEYTWTGSAWSLTNEVRYVYDGRLPIQERDGANAVKVTYTRGQDLSGTLEGAGGIGGLLARTDSAGHAYYSGDANGNVTCLFNNSGQVVARYSYDPYGNLMGMSGTLAAANLYRFSSKEVHPNSGLVYYLYRYYYPNLQRWLNRDPLGEKGGLNLHQPFEGDPIVNLDSYGLHNPISGPNGPVGPGSGLPDPIIFFPDLPRPSWTPTYPAPHAEMVWDSQNGRWVTAAGISSDDELWSLVVLPCAGRAVGPSRLPLRESLQSAELPATRDALHIDLRNKGFRYQGTSAREFHVTYKGPQGAKVTIKPTGEVIRSQKVPKSTGQGKFPQRQDYRGNPLPENCHKTGHYVEPIGDVKP
jgi:RHS repeat-associated protein